MMILNLNKRAEKRKVLKICVLSLVGAIGLYLLSSQSFKLREVSAVYEKSSKKSDFLFESKNENRFKAKFGDKKEQKSAKVRLEVEEDFLELGFIKATNMVKSEKDGENNINNGLLNKGSTEVNNNISSISILNLENVLLSLRRFTNRFSFIALAQEATNAAIVEEEPTLTPTPIPAEESKNYQEWMDFLDEARDVLSTSSSRVDKIATDVARIEEEVAMLTGEMRIESVDDQDVIFTSEIDLGVDSIYKMLPDGVREEIIIRDNNAVFSTYEYFLSAEKYFVGIDNKKNWYFADKTGGGNVFKISNIEAKDSRGKTTKNITVQIVKDEGSSDYILKMDVDPGWLKDSEREFPIKIEKDIVLVEEENKKKEIILAEKETFNSFERPTFIFYAVDEGLVPTEAKILAENGDFVEIEKIGGVFYKIVIPDSVGFKPGKNSLVVKAVKDGEDVFYNIDFNWGVLAINPDKSIYTVGDEAFLSMAVLDNFGRMNCWADLTLFIKDPGGEVTVFSTEDESIVVSDECTLYTITKLPDYYTNYQTKGPGEYKLTLLGMSENGLLTIEDIFFVEENPDFDVRRVGHTRIFPQSVYPFVIEMKANKDFEGEIVEKVPDVFVISNTGVSGDGGVVLASDKGEIRWKVKVKKGDEVKLGYSFDAPDESPRFYTAGPLKIGDWEEKRVWQFAADAVSYGGGGGGCENNKASVAFSVNTGTLSDRVMVVMPTFASSNSITGIDWSLDTGETFIQVGGATADDGTHESQIWYLTNYTEGTGTITISYASKSHNCAGAGTFGGVDTSSPIDSSGNNTGSSTSLSVSATVVSSNSWGVGSFRAGSAVVTTEGGDQVQVWDNTVGSAGGHGSYDPTVGTGSQSMTWSINISSAYAASVIFLKQKVTGPTTAQQLRHGTWFSGGVKQGFTF